MPKIICITNQKGGVGKTTTASNLAASLSRYNKRVLILDMDPQGNCSQALGIDPITVKKTMKEFMLGQNTLRQSAKKTEFENISIISSNLTLATTETTLLSQGRSSTLILKERLSTSEADIYDYILIDCPPSLGFLSLNALNASTCILVPMQCEYFAMDALSQLLSTIMNVQKSNNPDLSILGILLTMTDSRTRLSLEIEKEVRNRFKDYVFLTSIPRNVSIPEALAKGIPVNRYKPGSQGSLAYASLAREVIERVQSEEDRD